MAKVTLNSDQDLVLSILADHGPMRFTTGRDLTACQFLHDHGYIADYGGGSHKTLTAKGRRYLREN